MTGRLEKFTKKIEPWHAMLAVIVTIVGGFFGARAWVRVVAQEAVLDEKFLSTLATKVRPTCIFNSRGSVEADLGAMEYIEDILVIPAPQLYGYEVVVKAKRHLAYAPLVTGLDVDLLPQSSSRGKLHDWSIIVFPQSTAPGLIVEGGSDTNRVHRFRLEILH